METVNESGILSVFVTGNKIYMVDRRITSVMVAQDARKGRRVLDRFGPSGGGNTLRPVCGCIIPVLRYALGLLEAMVGIIDCVLGVPLPPLYIRGAGLQGRFPSRLRVGVLVGYNCISCYTRKIGSYPYTAGSFL